jgi:hypothetical protein
VDGRCGFTNARSGTACRDVSNADAVLCDGLGNCVVCLEASDCSADKPVCLNNECLIATCGDAVSNGMETDVDCGGPDCSACESGKACESGTDCVSGFCEGAGGAGGASGVCQ